jgi:two-component system, OmpR family, response regulator
MHALPKERRPICSQEAVEHIGFRGERMSRNSGSSKQITVAGDSADKTVRHVLVVDDDPSMRDVIGDYLEGQNFHVSTASDGRGMARILADEAVDLIILDVQLTNEDGFDLMRGLGGRSDAPVILVTGHRREEADRVVGLELGADDYLVKPFGLRELLARVRAVLRRSAGLRSRKGEKRIRYRFAGWELNMRTRTLTSPTGSTAALTAGEFNLLTAFLQSPQQILSREQLLAATRVHDEEVFDRSIDIQILRLRRKLEANPSEPQLIRTERGAGYIFTAPVEIL